MEGMEGGRILKVILTNTYNSSTPQGIYINHSAFEFIRLCAERIPIVFEEKIKEYNEQIKKYNQRLIEQNKTPLMPIKSLEYYGYLIVDDNDPKKPVVEATLAHDQIVGPNSVYLSPEAVYKSREELVDERGVVVGGWHHGHTDRTYHSDIDYQNFFVLLRHTNVKMKLDDVEVGVCYSIVYAPKQQADSRIAIAYPFDVKLIRRCPLIILEDEKEIDVSEIDELLKERLTPDLSFPENLEKFLQNG